MNKHCCVPLLLGYFSLLFSVNTAACDYDWISDCSSQIQLQINGVSDSFKIADCPSGYDFDGLNIGIVQSISLINANAITWESCQNNVTGVQLKYRVYEQGFPIGNWLALDLQEDYNILDGPYTTRHRSQATSISLSSGLTVGKTYTIEVYFEAAVDTSRLPVATTVQARLQPWAAAAPHPTNTFGKLACKQTVPFWLLVAPGRLQ